MKKRLFLTMILPFFSLVLTPKGLESKTIRVPQEYPTISAGLRNAESGDIVLLSEGIFLYEHEPSRPIYIPESVILSGSGPGKTIITTNHAEIGYYFWMEGGSSIKNLRMEGGWGGGIVTRGAGCSINNVIFYYMMWGIYTTYPDTRIVNNVFAEIWNCIRNYASPIDIRNNIFAHNIATIASHSNLTLYNDFWQNSDNYCPGGNLSVDPSFVSFPEDMHLKMSSLCIDAGDPNISDPDGSRSDIGAYGGPDAIIDQHISDLVIEYVALSSMDTHFRPKRFYIFLKNQGNEMAKDVSGMISSKESGVVIWDQYVDFKNAHGGEVISSNDDFEVGISTDIDRIELDLDLIWKDPAGGHVKKISFNLPNPGTEYRYNWEELTFESLFGAASSFLLWAFGIPDPLPPLHWLIAEISGGIARDSVLLFFVDEEGNLLDNVEVRNVLFESQPAWKVWPSHIQWSKEGIVYWTDAEDPLPMVRVMKDDQKTYINLGAFDNLPEPEIPIITVIFYMDGRVETLYYSKIRVEGKKLSYKVGSPLDILITDPLGYRIGYSPFTDEIVYEISEAEYNQEDQTIEIKNPLYGNYEVLLYGSGNGQFSLSSSLGDITRFYFGTILKGQILSFRTTVESDNILLSIPYHLPEWRSYSKLRIVNFIYSELELLENLVNKMNINQDVKEGLLDKLVSSKIKVEQAMNWINEFNEKNANNMLKSAGNIMNSFLNLIGAQKNKKTSEENALSLGKIADDIINDIYLAISYEM